ncbi:MAG: peptidylprolyl isomerase [Chlorobi bacterium]|nr:peptidylprolyl isomerase [Chlorobiota bacterium]
MKHIITVLAFWLALPAVLTAQQRLKADGIAAVVGNEAVFVSDIQAAKIQLKEQGLLDSTWTDCKLLENILKEKVLVNEAQRDTVIAKTVTREAVRDQARQQLNYIKAQAGGLEEVLEMYGKNNEEELLEEITEFNYKRELANAMRNKITEKVDVTPDEIRRFYESIPPDQLPEFPTRLELQQIVIRPKPDPAEEERVKNRLAEIREAILKGEKSFRAQAILYSEDPSTRISGGLMTVDKNTPLVQEFKDVVFSLEEGEISEPFRTEFGWHIVMVEKIKGRKRDIRHILLIPKITRENKEEARKKLEEIREKIAKGELTFEEAARNFSDDEQTAKLGGLMVDPNTNETLIEVTRLEPQVYARLIGLGEGDMTSVVEETDPLGRPVYKLYRIRKKVPAHKADFVKDYARISQLALEAKKNRIVNEWIADRLKEIYVRIDDDYKNCDFELNWTSHE